jgi:hypothetical protein
MKSLIASLIITLALSACAPFPIYLNTQRAEPWHNNQGYDRERDHEQGQEREQRQGHRSEGGYR